MIYWQIRKIGCGPRTKFTRDCANLLLGGEHKIATVDC